MKLLMTVGLVVVGIAIGVAEPSGAEAGTSPQQVAEAWVRALAGGNTMAACDLQLVREVEGVPCASLPRIVYHCKKEVAGTPAVPARTPSEQVGAVKVSGSRATAWITSMRRSSNYRAMLTLRRSGGWQIDSLQARGHVFSPAGLVASKPYGSVLQRLWPGCTRFAFPGRTG
jgi:hypothetical protein